MSPSAAPQSPNIFVNSAQSALMEGLQPTLRSTLSSLNINLDYELARYRYAKRGATQPSMSPPQFRPRQRSLSLMAVPQPARTKQLPAQAAAVVPPLPPPNPRIQLASVAAGTTTSESEVAALRSAIIQQPDSPQETYLASSEALLQSFEPSVSASPHAATRQTTGNSRGFKTPLGLGALMLLLVASAGLGFVLVNPSAASQFFQHTPLARFFPSETEDDSPEAIAAGDAAEDEIASAAPEGSPLAAMSPDLSQREFTDLDLNSLSSLPSNSAAVPLDAEGADEDAGARAKERDRSANSASGSSAPANSPQRVTQIPQTTSPAPQTATPYAAPATPAPAATPAPQPAPPTVPAPATTNQPVSPAPAANTYYVVTDYTGDPSLNEARTVVEDAYVRNYDIGARIQMGAFSSEAGAAALTEELRGQGIEAEIYEPE
ncbi:MAG: hypothetical protein ACFB0E_16110 [Leptolyngbyaceae cyanobacterium]